MATSTATMPEGRDGLPADRRETVALVRDIIRKHLPKGYREAVNWGMLCSEVPLERFPDTGYGQPLCYVAVPPDMLIERAEHRAP
jgi:hypothetical protein